ncbi:hypothetical protein BDV11DRAFT_180357 [Aspergillus similis]
MSGNGICCLSAQFDEWICGRIRYSGLCTFRQPFRSCRTQTPEQLSLAIVLSVFVLHYFLEEQAVFVRVRVHSHGT